MVDKLKQNNILQEARFDLIDDFNELYFLHCYLIDNLNAFKRQLNVKFVYEQSYQFLDEQAQLYSQAFQVSQRKIKKFLSEIKRSPASSSNIEYYTKQKEVYFDLLRSKIGVIGSLLTATDWQSPSYLHSIKSQAGTQTGHIIATINDYKRDQHLNENAYERYFIQEYIDSVFKFPIHAYLVNSGMAAFTTILIFLQMNRKISGSIIIGRSIYFENKELVKKIFKGNVYEVNEVKTNEVIQEIINKNPSVIILDSICNADSIAAPDLITILKFVIEHCKSETYFVIDNTALSIALQPLKYLIFKNSKVRLIVFESLNKYHQFGFDRVTAGLIWAWGKDTNNLLFARVHTGSNIIDSSCYVLPSPNRKMLKKRLARFNRNAVFIASALSNYLDSHRSSKIGKIIYPGLINHPSYGWIKKIVFSGSYLTICFKTKYRTTDDYQRFIKEAINSARQKKVNLVAGTSFGFNNTRVYLTALNDKFGDPFIRVAVGTENRLEIEKIKDVLIDAINQV